jgi:hypothetical protein
MTKNSLIRVVASAGLATLLAGCSMGSMFGGGGGSTASNANLQNATATPAAVPDQRPSGDCHAVPAHQGAPRR